MERNVRCNTGRLATNLIASRVNEDDIKSYEIFFNSSLCLCLVSDAYHYRHADTHREGEATALYTLVCQHLSESSKSQTFLAQQVILTNYHVYAAAA